MLPSDPTAADADLAAAFQGGDRRALEILVDRYRRFARAKARGYFLVGGDADDIEQEALIGLYKAVRDFRPEHDVAFRAFAELCMTRQVLTAIKSATRQKHQPLNRCASTSAHRSGGRDGGGEERDLDDLVPSLTDGDPLDVVVGAERMDALRAAVVENLTSLEIDVLQLFVAGHPYSEIGGRLGRPPKSVDNAVQRIKRKLERYRSQDWAEPAVA